MISSNLPTVIIPIHNAPDELSECLSSLHRTIPEQAEVVLIDDGSQDSGIELLLRHWQERVGSAWRFEFQNENRGFVDTANRGMEMTHGDVVLLNSDTVLTPGWLEGLQRCLHSDAKIATATPWTNNGEIASIPWPCQVNRVPANPDAIANLIGQTGQAEYPDIPTAVGFCMAITRHAIDTLGLFDQELFGMGYGEENDFSMRASQNGLRNVLCDDVFVAHVGGRSFEPKGIKPDESAMRKLLSRHPAYLKIVQDFIASDPLSKRRNDLIAAVKQAGIDWT